MPTGKTTRSLTNSFTAGKETFGGTFCLVHDGTNKRMSCMISNSIGRMGLRRKHHRFFTSKPPFTVKGTLHELGPIVGAYAEIHHAFTQDAVNTFADLCGDTNPIHFDRHAAQQGGVFQDKVVHGLLVSGLFSTLFGRVISGSIYVKQSLHFKSPVYIDAMVHAKMTVIKVDDWKRRGMLITCTTVCTCQDVVVIDGEAKVLIPPSSSVRHNLTVDG